MQPPQCACELQALTAPSKELAASKTEPLTPDLPAWSRRSTSGVSAGEGASSSSFWLRRWMEQSRSPRWITLPCLSASTCAQRTPLICSSLSCRMQITSWLHCRHSAPTQQSGKGHERLGRQHDCCLPIRKQPHELTGLAAAAPGTRCGAGWSRTSPGTRRCCQSRRPPPAAPAAAAAGTPPPSWPGACRARLRPRSP